MMQPVSAWPPEREQTVRDRPPPNGSAGRGAASHSTIVRATARDWQPDSHGQTRNPRMSSISMRRLGDLVPIHALGMNSSTERILRRMSDDPYPCRGRFLMQHTKDFYHVLLAWALVEIRAAGTPE